MPYRKVPLVETEIYHVFTKSIAGFKIFNSEKDYERMQKTIIFYITKKPPCKFSMFLTHHQHFNKDGLIQLKFSDRCVKIIAYCLMPTHIHLILQQLESNSISKYMNLVLKSYSKYFNIKHNRKGPLWEGRFKNVLVNTDEQLLHLTRYIHLNPVSISLVNKPQDWTFSSYREYIDLVDDKERICDFSGYFDIDSNLYKKFVEEHIDYQKGLEIIKHLILE